MQEKIVVAMKSMELEEVQALVGHFGEFLLTLHERHTYCWAHH
jgi:hypothetical protein